MQHAQTNLLGLYKADTISASVNSQRKSCSNQRKSSLGWRDWISDDRNLQYAGRVTGVYVDLLGSFATNLSREDLKADLSWVELKHTVRAAQWCERLCGWPMSVLQAIPLVLTTNVQYKSKCLSQFLPGSFLTSALSLSCLCECKGKSTWRWFQAVFMLSKYLSEQMKLVMVSALTRCGSKSIDITKIFPLRL